MEQEAKSIKSSLDRPVLSICRVKWETVLLLLIVLILVFTRLWDLGNRSFGHDESIHAWEAWKLATGQGYRHDPVYHGPFGYHVVAFVYTLFGINDVTARLASASFGIALVLLVLLLRRWLGRAGTLLAMFLLTISPTLMYRSRYFRHDIWLMVAALVMVIAFFHYLEDKKERWLYIIAGALAVAMASKAIAFIYGAIFGSFWVIYLLVEWVRTKRSLKELPAFDLVLLLGTLALPLFSSVIVKGLKADPLDYSQAGMTRSTVIVFVLLGISAAIGVWWKRKAWLISAGIYYGIYILFYTTLFTNARGMATGMVGMLGYWLSQQGVKRGGQPWYYFYLLNLVYEFLPSLLTAMGAVYFLVGMRRKAGKTAARPVGDSEGPRTNTFVSFLLYWTVTNFLIWTWAGEKMPWQNMHLVLPLGLVGGWFAGKVWESTDWRKLVQQGAVYAAVLLPVTVFSLIVLLSTITGPSRPFSGMALEQLEVTLRWLLSLILLCIGAAMLYRFARGLGWSGWSRVLLAALFIVLTALTLRSALTVSFINQDYATELLGYADSTPDTGAVIRELEELSRRVAGEKELRVAYDDDSSWPFVWYLRDFKNASFFAGGGSPASDAQVVIIGPENESKVKSQLSGKYVRRDYRLIWWPNQDVYSNLTPGKLWSDLKDPARRKFWWDILWWRKYPQPATSWPYVHKFALYVRKDIAAQLWDYGPEVAGPGIELPEDEYEKKRVQTSAVIAWGSYGTAPGQFNYPKGVAVDGQGNVYVVDSYNHRIQVFDGNGRFLREWGGQGNAPGQFQEPWGAAVDQAGNVYVADTWNHRIQKFDSQGRFLAQWGTFGDTAGALGDPKTFYGPRDIAVDAQGNLLVSDTGNKRVVKFTAEGEFLQQWGGNGSETGQFRESVGVAVDQTGNAYIADTWNQRIQKFDANSNFVTQWPVVGWDGEGVTNKPYVAVDGSGNVYVTAPDYHWVVKFDGNGKVLAVWGQFGEDLASLNMPSGIAVDSTGQIYVIDSANHRVLKFAPVP